MKLTGDALVIPGVSLPKLQLQSMVDLVLSVGISDVQDVFTWQNIRTDVNHLNVDNLRFLLIRSLDISTIAAVLFIAVFTAMTKAAG